MRKNYLMLLLPVVAILSLSFVTEKISVQNKESQQFITNSKIDSYIDEVYGQYAEELVYNTNKYRLIKDLIRNRIEYKQQSEMPGKNFKKLSDVPLINKYNPNLKRDLSFNPNEFNPLKYQMDFFNRYGAVYRVDNTNYLIVIKSPSSN